MPEHDNREFDAGQIQVKVKDGRIIRLDELVKVVRMEEQPQSYYRINGLNSIYLSVVAEEAANQLELSKKVQACMDDIDCRFRQDTRFIPVMILQSLYMTS